MTVGELAREGEGGEGFYIAQTGRPADLLVILGGRQNWEEVEETLPFQFWQ